MCYVVDDLETSKEVAVVVTIDGPAASGKSSVSRELASQLGWAWVSTGAFYRGLALVAHLEGVDAKDSRGLVALAGQEHWFIQLTPELTRVIWRGQDVTERALSEEVGSWASRISQIPEVRQALLMHQRRCSLGRRGLIAEGRDCGTVVFPHALAKVYLTASQERRAERRAREQGLDVSGTREKQMRRDHQDLHRSVAPLQVPADAIVIDSEELGLEEVVAQILALIGQRAKLKQLRI